MAINITNARTSPAARRAFSLVNDLTDSECDAMIARLKARRGINGAHAPVITNGDDALSESGADRTDWLTLGIEHVLRTRGLLPARVGLLAMTTYRWAERPPRERRRLRDEHAAAATAALEPLRNRLLPDKPTAAELSALGRFAAECLADYVEARVRPDADGNWVRVPVSPRTMRQYVGEAAAAVAAAFPGYDTRMLRRMCLKTGDRRS